MKNGTVVLIVIFLIYGLAQLIAGYVGIEHYFGKFWASVALIAALFFHFTLPITIGSFFCAWKIWNWPWILAAIFAVPGLILIIPNSIDSLMNWLKNKPSEI